MTRLGSYTIVRPLVPERTYLAVAPGDRQVVLKLVEPDCLQHGRLHPSIHERLSRVRELAHRAVANLYGVESLDSSAYLLWQYLPGQTFDEYVATLDSPERLTPLVRELILAVEALHALGIVHGRIHAGNVIIDDRAAVRLTHISPLLFSDASVDARDLIEMLRLAAASRGWEQSPLGRAVADAAGRGYSLSQLRSALSLQSGESLAAPAADSARRFRRRWLLAAVLTAAGGCALAIFILHMQGSQSVGQPTAPQAPPAAFDRPSH